MHPMIGNYSFEDVKVTSAWDVGENKIGQTLEKAFMAEPNYVNWISLPKSNIVVKEAPILDSVSRYTKNMINPVRQNETLDALKRDILREIEDTKTEILVNYLPVGSAKATKFWAQVCLDSGGGFVNCIPEFVASDKK